MATVAHTDVKGHHRTDAALTPADVIARLIPYRRPLIVLVHAALIAAAYYMAFLLRFDFLIPEVFRAQVVTTLPILLTIRLLVFAWFHLYEGLWRYVSIRDVVALVQAILLSTLVFVSAVFFFVRPVVPRSIYVLDAVLCLTLVGGARVAIRLIGERPVGARFAGARRALIVGAGNAGEALMRDIDRHPVARYYVVGFLDDNRKKHGRIIHGVPVLGGVDQLPEIAGRHGVEELLLAVPSATPEERARMLDYCRQSRLPFKTVPALQELMQGKAQIDQLEELGPEALLAREPVELDNALLDRELRGATVLVTGAAGSIGSELCRQLCAFAPARVVLVDQSESTLYFLDLELRRDFPEIEFVPIVGDILARGTIERIFRRNRPDIVYHAAAYKHVPLMESNPCEAVRNNIFGTETVANAAREAGARKFVLVSSDKAVAPAGVMGRSKRIAECLTQALNGGGTRFVSVRFGNVLGSVGSVLPLFKQQIEHGGPVTITNPYATRYFMLIAEAAQLVLQAGAMGKGGEIFFLDMGEPVRIMDLAENMIRLAGLEPGRDIEVETIGLRPGERLTEELVKDKESLQPSSHDKVLVVRSIEFDAPRFLSQLGELREAAFRGDGDSCKVMLENMAAQH